MLWVMWRAILLGSVGFVSDVCDVFESVVYVRYLDHVMYHRCDPLLVSLQTRETVGWLVYECEQYVTIRYDRDCGPPTLKGGDAKASGLCLFRSAILEMQKLDNNTQTTTMRGLEYVLNNEGGMLEGECALSATKVKNSFKEKHDKRGKYRCYSHKDLA